MSISSEQYKSALFEICRRQARVPYEGYRVAYYDMIYQVLEHDGVTVDLAGYNGFRTSMEGYLNYLSDAGLLTPNDIFNAEDFSERINEYWGSAFAAIGITFSATKGGDYGPVYFSFTYPDGVNEVYALTHQNYDPPAYLNIRFYSTLDYARKIMPYWDTLPTEDTIPLNELAGNRASFVTNWEEGGLYWHYNSELQEIEFTGEGELKMTPSQFTTTTNGLGLGTVLTAIYGAGVTALPTAAFSWGSAGETRTIVCLHGATDTVTLGGTLSSLGSSTSSYTLEIYCDNEAIRAGTFGDYVTVNWHALSEWTGGGAEITIPYGATYYVGVTSNKVGDYTGAIATYSAGDQFPAISDGDVYVYGDYEYRYNRSFNGRFIDNAINGWCVRVIDNTKETYGVPMAIVNGGLVKNMDGTFYNCGNLTSLDLTGLDTSNVTSMECMFQDCPNLTTLDLSSFNTSNVTSMIFMFTWCYALTAIYVGPGWTTTNADTDCMFDSCGVSSVTLIES